MESDKEAKEQNARTGRRSKNAGPAFPRDDVDRLLVHGEAVERDDGKGPSVHYPSFRELAERYGVSHGLIARYAKQHNCIQRREQTQKRAHEMADTKLAELRADELSVRKDDIVRIIDRFLIQFEEAIADSRVRCDNPSDYNVMVRLRAFVLGDADARSEIIGGLTIEDLEQRHKEMLESWKDSSPGTRGEVIKMPTADSDEKGKSDVAH
ncbi:MAG: hypothetical protein GY847_26105 [Proteobacteria bacterium]|nr:hypothetical protein [Pseudomonadota bacterium]